MPRPQYSARTGGGSRRSHARSANPRSSGPRPHDPYASVLPSESSSSSSTTSSCTTDARRTWSTAAAVLACGAFVVLVISPQSKGLGGAFRTSSSSSTADFRKALDRATAIHCPSDPPSGGGRWELERHDHQTSHGDICRQVNRDKRLGFECPDVCVQSGNGGPPFCSMSKSVRPCRVPRGETERPYRCDPHGGERGVCVLADGPSDQFKGNGMYRDATCDGKCGDGHSPGGSDGKRGGAPCSDDWDCSLAGECVDGRCRCDGWAGGSDCSYLRFQPLARGGKEAADGAALGLSGAGTSGYVHSEHTSWGGSAVLGTDGRYHMFVSEILCSETDRQRGRRRCGLDNWQTLSQVAHVVSETADVTGPYTRVGTVLEAEAHNPTLHVSPVDNSWNLFYISKHSGPTAVVSSSDEGKSWSSPVVVSRKQNPAPLLKPDGSMTMYFRGDGGSLPSPTCSDEYIGKEDCQSRDATCRSASSSPLFGHTAEDPSVFVDKRGNYHMLMNALPYLCVPKTYQGGHAWSRDGVKWSEPRVGAFTAAIEQAGGDTMECERRERPQMVLDPDPRSPGQPLALVSALVGCPRNKVGGAYGGGNDAFTLVQKMAR